MSRAFPGNRRGLKALAADCVRFFYSPVTRSMTLLGPLSGEAL